MTRHRRSVARRVTIKDVARVAGVSASTVSNYLNDRSDAMTEETRQRVKETIQALGYRRSSIARGLVTRQTATLGVILAEIGTPLFLQALVGIEPLARAAGYSILLCSARSLEDERRSLNLLLEKDVDGILFLSTSEHYDDDHLLELYQSGLPLVLVNRTTKHREIDQVHWDNAAGVAAAVEHLVQAGHRHIAHLEGPAERRSTEERIEGYRRGLEACGLEYRRDLVRSGDYTATPDDWSQSALELLDVEPRPTAMIAADDVVAAVAMKTVQNKSVHVPQDLAIVGIDDQPFCTYLNPSLTTVRLPILEAGMQAIELLLDRIAQPNLSVRHVMLPCPLIRRESCGSTVSAGVLAPGVEERIT